MRVTDETLLPQAPLPGGDSTQTEAKGADETDSLGEAENNQSVRVRLASALLVAAALILLMVIDENTTATDFAHHWILRLVDRLIDGIIVFGCATFLAETKLFKSYLERRITRTVLRTDFDIRTHLDQIVRSDFLDRVVDTNFLRTFDVKTLAKAEGAVRRASFAQDLPLEVESFHESLDSVRRRLDVWRTRYRERLDFAECPGHPELAKFVVSTEWVYLNYSADRQPKAYKQRFTERLDPIAGITEDELFRVIELEIGGQNMLPSLAVSRQQLDGDVFYDASVDVIITPATGVADGVTLKCRIEGVRPRSMPWVSRFFYPVHEFRFVCHCLPGMDPLLHIFGVGSNQEQVDPWQPADSYSSQQYSARTWEYDGWLLPNHGFLVTF